MNYKKRLVLHVGLPKTGTSALQQWCASNRQKLLNNGVKYPKPDQKLIYPNHQFMVNELMKNNTNTLNAIIEQKCNKTIIISAEGLSNHLYDFSSKALKKFRETVRNVHLAVFVVLRDKNSWTRSYYKQAVINPPIAEYNYATALSYEDFSVLGRTRRLQNTQQLCKDLQTAYQADEMVCARYEEDWMGIFLETIGVEDCREFLPLSQENASISDDLVEVIRQINALGLAPNVRATCLEALRQTLITNHRVLKFYPYAAESELGETIDKDILACLVPQTEEQARLIRKLSYWSKQR